MVKINNIKKNLKCKTRAVILRNACVVAALFNPFSSQSVFYKPLCKGLCMGYLPRDNGRVGIFFLYELSHFMKEVYSFFLCVEHSEQWWVHWTLWNTSADAIKVHLWHFALLIFTFVQGRWGFLLILLRVYTNSTRFILLLTHGDIIFTI